MKCIKKILSGEVSRVSDSEALDKVRSWEAKSSEWVFCPKSDWKSGANTKSIKKEAKSEKKKEGKKVKKDAKEIKSSKSRSEEKSSKYQKKQKS